MAHNLWGSEIILKKWNLKKIVYTTPCGKKIENNKELKKWFNKVEMDPSDLYFIHFDFERRTLPKVVRNFS